MLWGAQVMSLRWFADDKQTPTLYIVTSLLLTMIGTSGEVSYSSDYVPPVILMRHVWAGRLRLIWHYWKSAA